jgi:8-oxo-dGTP pyrophosphatase MutT (NUDIX family)
MEKEKSCGVILFHEFNDARRYLLIHSARNKLWGFPKGHVEQKETEKQTALRETYEEVGLKPRLLPKFRETINYYVRKNAIKDVIYFLGAANDLKVQYIEKEVHTHDWLTYDQAIKRLTFEDLRQTLAKAHNHIETDKLKTTKPI